MSGTWLGGTDERPGRFFATAEDFRLWLEQHHDTETELWMGLFKKHAADRGLTWPEAVPVALCYGWIDSVAQRIDDDTTRQRWTPRKPGSIWSKINVAHVERLIAEGKMTPAGLAAYERRSPDRTGIYSFESEAQELPAEYDALLRADVAAAAFFYDRATPSYRRTCVHWVLGAKQEKTRDKRLAELIAESAAGRMVKSFRSDPLPKWAQG